MFGDFISNVSVGLLTAFSLDNIFFCFLGVLLGTFVGVIPGVGTLATMSMLFPMTFYLDPTTAIIMLAGIWYGSNYGGSTASILLNLPGTPANAVTCLDGFPMAKQGRAGVALFMTTVASFFGASFGIILMMILSQPLASIALSLGSAEYFSLMIMGLIVASVISEGSVVKSIAVMVLGVALGVVGTDVYTGTPRFTFGELNLLDGVNLVALAMGVFGVAEVIYSIRNVSVGEVNKNISLKSMLPTGEDVRRSWLPMLRGSSIGSFIGVMPGVGAAIGSFMSYAVEKRVAKDPSRFGKGAIEGIVGPETTNNAADQTSFIPTLVLGIPGSVTMALILGVLIIHGVTPGPTLLQDRPEMFWGLVMSFWIGNILLLILNIPLIGVWVRVLSIPYHFLYPAIIMFICIGVYAINNSAFDVMTVIVFGALGYGLRALEFPTAPLLLGFVLGPMVEEHFRRSMILSGGDVLVFFQRPVSLSFLIATAVLLAWSIWSLRKSRRIAVV